MAFSLGLSELAAALGRLGLSTKIDVDSRRVAYLSTLTGRDAPVFASATADLRFVVLEQRLPFTLPAGRAAEAVAALNQGPGLCRWVTDPGRGAVSVRLAIPMHETSYTDAALAAVVEALAAEAGPAAEALATGTG